MTKLVEGFTVDIAAAVAKQPSGMVVIDVTASGAWNPAGAGSNPWTERLSMNFAMCARKGMVASKTYYPRR